MSHIDENKEQTQTPEVFSGIGEMQVREAAELLSKYRQGKQSLDKRIVENDQWWRLRHWDVVGRKAANDPQPASAWLFNSVANKHGDAMDNAPEPVVLPRERSDEQDAKSLSEILPSSPSTTTSKASIPMPCGTSASRARRRIV